MTALRMGILGLVVMLGTLAPGREAAAADEPVGGRVTLQCSSPMEVAEFLSLIGQALDVPLLWDPKARGIQGKAMTGDLSFEGTRAEILSTVRGILTFYELVMIPVGQGENERLLVMDARATSSMVKNKPRFIEVNEGNVDALSHQDGLYVTTALPVVHLDDLGAARNALQRIVTGQNIGNVTEVPAARAFVVTDFAPNVASIYRLLHSMDVPMTKVGRDGAEREVLFRAIRLKHAPAVPTAATLVKHFGIEAPQPAQAGYRPRPQQASSHVPPRPRLRIHADVRLNQILVRGMRKDVDDVAEVIATLDQALPRSEMSIQYIRLQHAQAMHAASTLTNLIGSSPALWSDGPSGPVPPAVQADVQGNALLLHAAEPTLTSLLRLIAEIDTPRRPEEEAAEGYSTE